MPWVANKNTRANVDLTAHLKQAAARNTQAIMNPTPQLKTGITGPQGK
jgi:hypothetical protein